MSQDLMKEGVLAGATFLSSTLMLGIAFSFSVCLMVFNEQKNFKVFGVDLPNKWFFDAALLYTALHAYSAYVFCDIMKEVSGSGHSKEVYETLRMKGPILFLGMHERSILYSPKIFREIVLPVVRLPSNDATTWLYHGFLLVVSVAFWQAVKFRVHKGWRNTLIAVGIIVTNWIIGSYWNYFVALL